MLYELPQAAQAAPGSPRQPPSSPRQPQPTETAPNSPRQPRTQGNPSLPRQPQATRNNPSSPRQPRQPQAALNSPGSPRKKHKKVTKNAQKTLKNLFWSDLRACDSARAETLADQSSKLQLLFAKVSTCGEPLAPRSEPKRQKTRKKSSS